MLHCAICRKRITRNLAAITIVWTMTLIGLSHVHESANRDLQASKVKQLRDSVMYVVVARATQR
ncbi:MAG: hypothetical protein HC886_20220 [Leptolyngbyaceae cyanobacterium SM1_1_3]|nr:hypothetical protein [Leptolyngbyaceae cyanobacterium SM1_1_3]NJN01346.1 hypothetical protein [Leptolyngbyaceae cyanobacterium RM1_1_2]NJO10697.1 hypothetical protein [Leptolyngbyaceae cyanobacterium SL_1_1]